MPNGDVEAVSLGRLVKVCKGKQVNGVLLSDTGPYYVMNGGITPSGYYDTFNTPPGTISISEGGNSCGYVQFNDDPFWSGGHCYTLLEPNTAIVNYKYLFHYLKSLQDKIMALRIGSGLPNIQKKDLEKFPLLLPSLAFRNMLHNGLSQSERIILRHCFLTDGYMSQQIRGQINNGVPVSCVWIFDGSEVRVLYNTEG